MKRLFVLAVLCLVIAMSGCAAHYGCLEEKVDSIKEEVIVTKSIVAGTNIRVTRIDEIIKRDCRDYYGEYYNDYEEVNASASAEADASASVGYQPVPVVTTTSPPPLGAAYDWVIRPSIQDGTLHILANPNLIRAPQPGEFVVITGDPDGWKYTWRMNLTSNGYETDIPLSQLRQNVRIRMNYVVKGAGVPNPDLDWAMYSLANDPTWTGPGDGNKTIVDFMIKDGQVIPIGEVVVGTVMGAGAAASAASTSASASASASAAASATAGHQHVPTATSTIPPSIGAAYDWVIRPSIQGGNLHIIANPNLMRAPQAGEFVVMTGDPDGWKYTWRMNLTSNGYETDIPLSQLRQNVRIRMNYVVKGAGVPNPDLDWAMYSLANDPTWTGPGDGNKTIVDFMVQGGTVVPVK